jgi:hypothetical protein
VIVEAQPTSQGTAALGVGAIQPRIGPLIEQGLVEPFDLAVGLGSIPARALEPDPQASGRVGKTIDSA